MKKILILLIANCFYLSSATAQLWQILPTNDKPFGTQLIHPRQFITAKLDINAFNQLQTQFSVSEQANNITLELPQPNGEIQEFYIYENPVLPADLQGKYPVIKTYTGIAVNNSACIAKIDFTYMGFHAMVMDFGNTYFIDPYVRENQNLYLVYYKKNFVKQLNHLMHCELDENKDENAISLTHQLDLESLKSSNGLNKTFGTTKRTYDLAMACTGEYAVAVAGANPTKAAVLSAIVTSVNRVSGVYEKEFATHFNLVPNNDTLINLNGTTDPYNNTSSSAMLANNTSTINARIGSTTYDIGHVFSTGGGGLASLGCVCGSSKGSGVTGSPNPVGDPFDIDYVAHEIGHQFGGNHTFDANGTQAGSCNGNRSGSSAYEPGSGTTIMAYAGICNTDNIQSNSDAYFHIRSLNSISTFMAGGGNACATSTTLTNATPTFTTSTFTANYNVPYKTFFEVSRDAVDTDNDTVYYCWEQYNRATNGMAWNTATKTNPIFRSDMPTKSPQRVFPKIENCLANLYNAKGYRVADTNRTVTLKLCARSVRNGYGTFNYMDDSIVLNNIITPTLFRVTSHATAQTLTSGTTTTITWDVAGTNAGTVNTPNVNIYMSDAGGKNYPYLLAANTPNDGSESLVVPFANLTNVRFKVKGANNVFFDLNDGNLEIKSNAPASIADNQLSQIQVYPNPTTGLLVCKNITTTTNVKVINTLGLVVKQIELNSNNTTLDLSAFAKGVYQIQFTNQQGFKANQSIVLQ
jgi:hypothetical protein